MSTILEAMQDPKLFGGTLRRAESFRPWLAFLAALFGLPMDPDAFALYRACTGRHTAPEQPFTEAWLICGRRAGKSFMMAVCAVYLACFRSYTEHLGPGERATIMIIAADRKQARVVMRYIRGLLEIPMLARLVERETTESFDLKNRVTIEVGTASHRSVRGYTLAAVLADEIAFWPTEDSASPDYEILDALRPAMGTIPGALMLCASSPYARRGAMWDAFRRYHGQEAPVLVWKAPTRTMNPSFPQAIIDQACERDPSSAAAEYLAEFRVDVETFVAREVVEAAVTPGRFELPPVSGTKYVAFVDPSGGSSDSMTLAVAHAENGCAVLDAIRERKPPFSPEAVVQEFAELLKAYDVRKVTGDRWGGEFVREPFRERGISYELSERPKSTIYAETLPLLNSGKVELLDSPRLVAQLCGLERRTARGGKDSIDHAPGGHDDLVNSAAGALLLANNVRRRVVIPDNALKLSMSGHSRFLAPFR